MSPLLHSFEQTGWLLLLLPWLVFWWWFSRHQRRALRWIEGHVTPRFRAPFTRHDAPSLGRHLLRLLVGGGLLIAAAAGPRWPVGEVEGEAEGGRVLLFLDASASMYADDVPAPGDEDGNNEDGNNEDGNNEDGGGPPQTRFELVRRLARDVIRALPEHRFAVLTFSGITTLQVPLTDDRAVLEETLRVVEVHNFYRSSGSSLAGVLDTVLRYSDDSREDLQAIVLGDGEIPNGAAYDDPLAAVVEAGVPVHAITVGSLEGQERVIYDFRDVVAKKEERGVLREYTTRRVDEHLRRIATKTGGTFAAADARATDRLITAVGRLRSRMRAARPESWRDLTPWALGAFLCLFLLDARHQLRRPTPPSAFEVERLGRGRKTALVALVLLLPAGCNDDLSRAHRENERGIARDADGLHPLAQIHYRRSRKTRISAQIPTYNQARSATLSGDLAAAHDLYQQALLLDPDLAEAYFNDGLALYRWGDAERDPRRCELERTLELWQAAASRFATAGSLRSASPTLQHNSRINGEALESNLAVLQAWISDPPAECGTPNPSGGGGGGAADEGSGLGAGRSEPPPPPADPPPPEAGGEPPPQDPDRSQPPPAEPPEADGNPGSAPESGGDPPPAAPPPEAPPPPEAGPDPAPITPDEHQDIRLALERITQQAGSDGTYHRRTLPEQFSKASWQDPDSEIWW